MLVFGRAHRLALPGDREAEVRVVRGCCLELVQDTPSVVGINDLQHHFKKGCSSTNIQAEHTKAPPVKLGSSSKAVIATALKSTR